MADRPEKKGEIKQFNDKKSRFTNIDFNLSGPLVTRILLALLAVIVLVFGVYQFYALNKNRSPLPTSTAQVRTITRSVITEGYVIRDETVLVNPGRGGTVVPLVENGSKVAIGDTVAQIFTSAADASRLLRLREVEEEIAYYENINSMSTGKVYAGGDLYNRNIADSLYSLTGLIAENDLSKLTDCVEEMSLWVTKRQIALGNTVDVSGKLNALYAERETLSGAGASAVAVTAPAAGYYVNETDGYEGKADFQTVLSITPQTLTVMENTAASGVRLNVGKLITQFNWYLTCAVNADEAEGLAVGAKVRITFSSLTDPEIIMVLKAKNPDSDGKVALIFSSNIMNSEIASLRHEEIKIFLEEYSGFPVERQALRTVDGHVGVYVQVGNIVRFRKVEIVYTDESVVLVTAKENESGYIKLYDEIIMEGTDLYDGKIIV